MSDYDNPVFYKHHKAPFTWTTMKWPRASTRYQSCVVSNQLAEELGWHIGNGKYPNDLVIGPLRLRVVLILKSYSELACERASGPIEEFVRGAFLRVKELVTSPFYYYFAKKNYG